MTMERNCEHCGVLFTPRRSTGRFHSDACRTAHGKARRLSEAKRTGPLNRLAPVMAIRAEPLTWDPPDGPYGRPYQTAERCGTCGEGLHASPAGTRLACLACGTPVVPAGVTRPYETASGGGERRVVSRRELDAARRDVAGRRAELAGGVRRMLESGRLDDRSAGRLGSVLEDLRDARDMTRLGELEEDIRAEISQLPAGTGDGGVIEGEVIGDDDGPYVRGAAGELVPAAWRDGELVPVPEAPSRLALPAPAAVPREPGAMNALGWRLGGEVGACQILEWRQHGAEHWCGKPTAGGPVTDHRGRKGWICQDHREAMSRGFALALGRPS